MLIEKTTPTKLNPKKNSCPKCGTDFRGEFMMNAFIEQRNAGQSWCKDMTDEDIENYIKEHYSPPYRFGRLIGVEIQGQYDGVSRWRCPDCCTEWCRFTNNEII